MAINPATGYEDPNYVPPAPVPAPAPAPAPTASGSSSGSTTVNEDDAKAESFFMGEGGEVVGGALIVNQKNVGEYKFGQFVPNAVGKAWMAAEEKKDQAAPAAGPYEPMEQNADLEPGTRTSTSPEYDPAEHEPVKPEAAAAVEKVNATNAAIAAANALTDEQKQVLQAQDAAMAAGQKATAAGRKKAGAQDSTGSQSTAPSAA